MSRGVAALALAIAASSCGARTVPVAPPAKADPPAAAPAPAAPPAPAPAPPDVAVVAREGHAEAIARRVTELAAAPASRVAAGDVGYYMDVQQARLQQLGTDRARVVRTGARLVLTLGTKSGFDSNSFRVTKEAEATLVTLAGTLREFEKTVVSVHGHSDASGGEAANVTLSERRALAVARLLADNGVDRRRLVVVGRGQADPVASNETEEGRERNRRIELYIDPIQIRGAPAVYDSVNFLFRTHALVAMNIAIMNW